MAKNKRTGLAGQALKDANAKISRLRSLGLYSGKPARGQPTKYAKSLLKKYDEAISGNAAVVKVPRDVKKLYSDKQGIKSKGDKLIIPKNRLNSEIVRFDKHTNEINIYGDGPNGKRYKKSLVADPEKPRRTRRGFTRLYRVPFTRRGGRIIYQEFDSLSELEKYMGQSGSARRMPNWRDYLEIIEVPND